MMKQAMKKSITDLITSPTQVAHALDWKRRFGGALLSLHLGERSIDLATTNHPSQDAPIHRLSSIPLEFHIVNNRKVLKPHVFEKISDIVRDMKICGLVVSWPVQKEGWCGASCGKVLHTLDQIVQETNIVNKNRPLCLWDGHHFHLPQDEWGRVASYGVPNANRRQVHIASQEQYRDCGMVASSIAEDYLRHHWPDMTRNLVKDDSVLLNEGLAASTGKPRTPMVDPKWLQLYAKNTKTVKKAMA